MPPLTFDRDILSDLHKDAYGYRPGAAYFQDWACWTNEERQVDWDRMVQMVADNEKWRGESESAALLRWNQHIDTQRDSLGISRATALRWDMQAMEAEGDPGYYCYLWGLSYDMAAEIMRDIARATA